MQPITRTSLLCLCLLLLHGCATLPPGSTRSPRDPWERMNRTTFALNQSLDKAVLRPVAHGYRKVTPQLLQTGFRNFMDNISYPITMVNDLLQGQFRPFVNDTFRLVLNSTIGIGGLFDPATRAGLDKNERDFGQTLGKWGVKSGPYFVIPVLGPSDVRDAFGRTVDEFTDPRFYIKNPWWNWGLWALDKVDLRSRLLFTDAVLDNAYDPYAFVRNAYLQRRDFLVNGPVPLEEPPDDSDGDSTSTPATPPAAPPGTPPASKPN